MLSIKLNLCLYLRLLPVMLLGVIPVEAADISTPSDKGTAFLESVEKGDVERVKRLMGEGVEVNTTRQGDGASALILASGKGFTQIATLLINKGANVNTANRNGWTPLMGAASNGHHKIVTLLLANGANVNARHSYGWTALKLASQKKHKEVMDLLVKNGAKK